MIIARRLKINTHEDGISFAVCLCVSPVGPPCLSFLQSKPSISPRQNVAVESRGALDGNTYYEQLNAGPLILKTGDCVYVKSEHSKQVIAQIDSMWTTPE